jgi:hypothetical protein
LRAINKQKLLISKNFTFMKKFDLNAYGVSEMNQQALVSNNGGCLPTVWQYPDGTIVIRGCTPEIGVGCDDWLHGGPAKPVGNLGEKGIF